MAIVRELINRENSISCNHFLMVKKPPPEDGERRGGGVDRERKRIGEFSNANTNAGILGTFKSLVYSKIRRLAKKI
eukprot:Pgem_evm1s18737